MIATSEGKTRENNKDTKTEIAKKLNRNKNQYLTNDQGAGTKDQEVIFVESLRTLRQPFVDIFNYSEVADPCLYRSNEKLQTERSSEGQRVGSIDRSLQGPTDTVQCKLDAPNMKRQA